jgi:hypothetical protein
MANGSMRRVPVLASAAAAVCSDAQIEPMNTPWFQSYDWLTSGTVEARLGGKIGEVRRSQNQAICSGCH